MFTGIVEEMGRVVQPAPRMVVRAKVCIEDLRVGDSINVNGACLTAVKVGRDTFTVDTVPETLRRTNLGDVTAGGVVNLERALAAGGRMGGHVVQGHVDGTGRVLSITSQGNSHIFRFASPKRLLPYIVEKGFIAVDGISLTVVKRYAGSFTVAIIPHSISVTNLGARRPGDRVNLEVDILAKYVESILQSQREAGARAAKRL